ncbi:MAG: protein kinase, partial [Acidobacteria bacterium]|nr:protein kinase [Acidobacteriota bacterium]
MSLQSGTRIGRYEIRSLIGAGGMGEVFLAGDTELERQVALKVLLAEVATDEDRVRRFVQEAKTASALNHPNILTVYEIGKFENSRFIATELIKGVTLRERLQGEALDLRETLDVAVQIASALNAAHQAGIVHRDVKPENVMLRDDGLVKVLDFGLAKLMEKKAGSLDSEGETRALGVKTSPGMVMGTVTYMSPEQARGKQVDARTDIFSFGVMLYEMLSGKLPFEGENALDVIGSILHKEPQPLNQTAPEIPRELQRIVEKCLRKDCEERYQTAKDLLIDLKDVKQDLEFQNKLERTASPDRADAKTQVFKAATNEAARATSSAEYLVGEIKRHKSASLVVLAVLLLAIGALGVWYFTNQSANTTQIESIAVLPFQNRSADADTEYLSDGLAESLIYRLSQLPALKVSPTSSVFRYKGKEMDARRVAEELGVDSVMAGRITQRGENLTISVELIDVRSNKLLWGEQYDRKMSELLATQREIATEISRKLELKLSGNEKGLTKRYTDNNEAYQLYLKGRYHFAKRTKDDMQRSIEYFQQAIRLDPNFALAYASIAECYNAMPAYPYLSSKEAFPLAKAAAQRALEIDPTLPEAHTALGNYLAVYDWNWAEAERSFKRAIELNPSSSDAHFRYGRFYLAPLGRHEEAISELKRAVELEPLSLITNAV